MDRPPQRHAPLEAQLSRLGPGLREPVLETERHSGPGGAGDAPSWYATQLTPEAIRYGVKELARRAGITAQFFGQCVVNVEEDVTRMILPNGREVRFPRLRRLPCDAGALTCARAVWWDGGRARGREAVSNFWIPFAASSTSQALFERDNTGFSSPFDLPSAVVLTLCRYEESLDGPRDQHGRFPAERSMAACFGFVRRPIVDEYGLAMEEVINTLCGPGSSPARRPSVKVTHDVDSIGLPFRWLNTLGHTVRRRAPRASLQDLLALAGVGESALLQAVDQVARAALAHGFNPSVYWKGCPRSARDTGYDPGIPAVRRLIGELSEAGVEMGVHPGYGTYLHPELLKAEVERVASAAACCVRGGRQHYLRWCPATWIHWEMAGLAYDSSVGFAEEAGFRAGTCIPYRPWLLGRNREAFLLELPLIAMDVTLLQYMGLDRGAALGVVEECVNRVCEVGGVFVLLWHNEGIIDPRHKRLYHDILRRLSERIERSFSADDYWY